MRKHIFFLMVISLAQYSPIKVNAQDQPNRLSFIVSNQIADNSRTDSLQTNDLIVEIDRNSIKKIERVYIKLLKKEDRSRALVKTIDREVLKGIRSDEKVKDLSFDSSKVKINLGSFDPGVYYLDVMIKDGKRQMYRDRQVISL